MVATRQHSIEQYVNRAMRKLLRRYPGLSFEFVRISEREGTIYYAPYTEDDDLDIVHLTGKVALEALLRDDYVIHIQPAPPERF